MPAPTRRPDWHGLALVISSGVDYPQSRRPSRSIRLESSRRQTERARSCGVTYTNGKTSVAIGALEPESLTTVGPDAPAACAVRLALIEGLRRLRENGVEAQRGDFEGVHRMRTAARRLRCELRLYHDLLDGDWSE